PGNGTFWTSPWFEDEDDQLEANKLYVLSHGFTAPSAGTVFARGTGQAWYFTNIAGGLNGTTNPASGPGAATPGEVQIEYEWDGNEMIGLFIGDSITEGLGGSSGLQNPMWSSWPHLWAFRNHGVAVNIAIASSVASDWQTASQDRWNRIDLASIPFDFVYINFGSNDINAWARTWATVMPHIKQIVIIARSKTGKPNLPVYIGNVTPRNGFDSAKETLRQPYNTKYTKMPFTTVGVVDHARAVVDPADVTQILAVHSF